MMKGKIVYFEGSKKFGFAEHDLPEVEPGAVLVKVLCTNICGSDVKNWLGSSSVGIGAKETCQGHEFVGEIYQLGEGVETDSMGQPVKVGDRIVAPYYITCGTCDACKAGRYDLCENAYIHLGTEPTQWPYFGGTFASHYYIYPDQKGGETLLIQGAGGLGIYAAAIAKEKGARVIMIDGVKERLEFAKRFGVDEIIDLNEIKELADREQRVKELTNGKGVNVALEVTGFAGAFEEGIRHLAVMGRYIVIGINSTAVSATISPGYITRKALTVYGVVRYLPEYLHKSLIFLEKYQNKYPFNEFSQKTFSLNEIGEALQLSADKKTTRAIIKP